MRGYTESDYLEIKRSYLLIIKRLFVILLYWQKKLFQLIAELDEKNLLVAQVVSEVKETQSTQWNVKARIKDWKASKWAARKYDDAKENSSSGKSHY